MREIRQSGSEGGAAQINASSLPLSIQKITGGNIAQLLPTLQVSQEIKADIQNAVNAGKEIIISQSNVQIDDWDGVGYIVKDTVTGAGAYMITGGLAGSDNTIRQDGMQIVELFKGALGWIKDKLDLQTRNTIVTAAAMNEGDDLTGQFIAQVAGSLENAPYNDIDCSQLVRLAYWAAGICLDGESGVFTYECRNGNNLAAKYHINVAGKNGVAIFYEIVEAQKDLFGGIRNENPLVGDMIFWDNTWDRDGDCSVNDKQTHMGIVKSYNADGAGTAQFIHSSSTKGVSSAGKMNRTNNILNGDYNTQLRLVWTKYIKCKVCSATAECGKGTKINPCTDENAQNSAGQRTNQLYAGYGTVRNPK